MTADVTRTRALGRGLVWSALLLLVIGLLAATEIVVRLRRAAAEVRS